MRESAEKRNAVQKPFSPLAWGAVIISVIVACSGLATEALAYYDVTVGTASANGAWAGNVWTPSGSGSTVAAAEIETRLGSGPVAITTGSSGSGAEAGNITGSTGVTWSANTLALTAAATITINAALNGSSTAGLALQYGQGAVAAGNASTYNVHALVNLAATGSFSTKLGSDGLVKNYTILTGLGAAGSSTGTDLQGMNGNLTGNYVLGANIDASATSGWNAGAGFAPVGTSATNFTGIFDGLGHTIGNLFINRGSTDYVGLFGYAKATLRNVGLVGVQITGNSRVGTLAGNNMTGVAIFNSYAEGGSVTGNNNFVGGLVGYNDGPLSSSYASATVSGVNAVGGLVGSNFDHGSISASYATGAVSGNLGIGGLVGANVNTITTSYSSGAVSGNSKVGGLVGNSYSSPGASGNVTNSYWDTGTSGQASGIGANEDTATFSNLVGLATANAYTQANYANLDFTNTWWMADGNTRPFLRSEYSTTITNAHQLQMMGLNLAASFTLVNNIDASQTAVAGSGMWGSAGFVPVGAFGTVFTGSFDGQGHVISGLTIDRPTDDFVGLLGYIVDATIANVGLAGGSLAGRDCAGVLAGFAGQSSISGSFSTATVNGRDHVGGLAGMIDNGTTIADSYASGAVTGANYIGGLAGSITTTSDVTRSYATGLVAGSSDIGGLAGFIGGGSMVTASFWDTQTSGQTTSAGGTGKTTAEMQRLATFAGWDIDDVGGTGKVWRIYDGYTYPLLRSFLTPLNVQPDYDGSGAPLINVGAVTPVGAYDATKVFSGSLYADTLTLSGTAADAYTATATAKNLSSTQTGYDLVAISRTIATLGSAAGDITLSSPISWTSGTLAIDTAGTITQTAAISGPGTAIFDLQDGTWSQVNGTLPGFAVYDFRIGSGTFVRVLSGDGSAGTPYQLADIYGIQGMGSSGMRDWSYELANDVDASGTANWNGGVGFNPVGTDTKLYTMFTGSFDGLGHVIDGLFIDRPGTNFVGLFGSVSEATLRNAGLTNVDISGGFTVGALAGRSTTGTVIDASYVAGGSVSGTNFYVGGLVGQHSDGTISSSYATATVSGNGNVGGLVGDNQSTITTSYATGAVSGNSSVGGLVGYNFGTVTSSFWDTQTSGQATSAAGTGKTTAEMQQLATFSGWDIDAAGGTGSVWRIYDGHTYPLLRLFLTPLTVTADNVAKSYDGVSYTSPLTNPSYSVPGADGSGHLFNLADPYQGAVEVGSYLPALWSDQQGYDISYIDGLLTISKAEQTVTFSPLPDRTYGDADFTISATASSGLTVSFASTTPGVCTVSGTTVHLVAPGTCSITASQAGDAHYNAAVDVSRTFMVNATVTPSAGPNGGISPSDPQVVAYNTTVSFTIVPAIGYHVEAVGGTCGGSYTGDPSDSVNGILYTTNAVTVDCTVSASFAINQYTVAAVAGPNGSLDQSMQFPQAVDHGSITQVIFHADTDYYIASIAGCGINYVNGDQTITTRLETTPPITGDCTVTATFAITTHQLTVIVRGKGTVASDSGGIECPGTCATTYDHNTIVTLTPTPESGGRFVGWSGDADCEDGTVTMTADLTCTAEFSHFEWWTFWPVIMNAAQNRQQGTTP